MQNNNMYTAYKKIIKLQEYLNWLASMGGEQWDVQGGDALEVKLSHMRREYDSQYLVWA